MPERCRPGSGESFSGAAGGDQEVVLDAETAAALPVDAGLDREHHALADLAAAGLVRVGRLVGAGADAVADRMGDGDRGADRVQARAHAPVELGQARSRPAERDRVVVDGDQRALELGVLRLQLPADEVLRVVGPVAVGAHPDLEAASARPRPPPGPRSP